MNATRSYSEFDPIEDTERLYLCQFHIQLQCYSEFDPIEDTESITRASHR